MILQNLSVCHKAFGVGTVIATQGKYMTVRFGCGDKSFVYPDSFEKFLTLADGSVSEEIMADIQVAKAAKQQIIDKKNEENLRSMTHGIVIPGKEIIEVEDEEKEDKSHHDDV
ncbi:MAG: hypothetical protein IKC32_04305 [Clostridia bacterium]|nr:hypothetical protein [Clostridia bacterium]